MSKTSGQIEDEVLPPEDLEARIPLRSTNGGTVTSRYGETVGSGASRDNFIKALTTALGDTLANKLRQFHQGYSATQVPQEPSAEDMKTLQRVVGSSRELAEAVYSTWMRAPSLEETAFHQKVVESTATLSFLQSHSDILQATSDLVVTKGSNKNRADDMAFAMALYEHIKDSKAFDIQSKGQPELAAIKQQFAENIDYTAWQNLDANGQLMAFSHTARALLNNGYRGMFESTAPATLAEMGKREELAWATPALHDLETAIQNKASRESLDAQLKTLQKNAMEPVAAAGDRMISLLSSRAYIDAVNDLGLMTTDKLKELDKDKSTRGYFSQSTLEVIKGLSEKKA